MKKHIRKYFNIFSWTSQGEYLVHYNEKVNATGVFFGILMLPFAIVSIPFLLLAKWLNSHD